MLRCLWHFATTEFQEKKSLKITLPFCLQVLFWLSGWWRSTASDHTPTSRGPATWTSGPVFWPHWQLPFSSGTSCTGVRTAWRRGSSSSAAPWARAFAAAWRMTMLSHHAERAHLKGERSPRRSALELFSINICYNLRVERHHNFHLCGQRPSIIIRMGSIYIHMYKPQFLYIYINNIILPSPSAVQHRIPAGSAGEDTKCVQWEYKKEGTKHFLCLHQVLLLPENKTKG